MYNFDVEKPTSVADAVKALSRDEAQPLSGGQTLIPTLKARLAMPSVLVSLSGIREMQGVRLADDGRLCIGGGTIHRAVAEEAKPHYPGLASLAARIGDPA
ncbi:MAG: FAD binding domain-containing protein, partial [Sulfitobacter sp.]